MEQIMMKSYGHCVFEIDPIPNCVTVPYSVFYAGSIRC